MLKQWLQQLPTSQQQFDVQMKEEAQGEQVAADLDLELNVQDDKDYDLKVKIVG